MYTILMNENKELITTKTAALYQREQLVDQIQFLTPLTYNDVDLSQCTVVFKYTDIGNVIHRELLTFDGVYKNNKLKYLLPVKTKLNQFAGTISGFLTFYTVDTETEKAQHILKTGETMITILPVRGVQESGEIDIVLAEIAAKMATMEEELEELMAVEHEELTEAEIQAAFNKLGI